MDTLLHSESKRKEVKRIRVGSLGGYIAYTIPKPFVGVLSLSSGEYMIIIHRGCCMAEAIPIKKIISRITLFNTEI